MLVLKLGLGEEIAVQSLHELVIFEREERVSRVHLPAVDQGIDAADGPHTEVA